MRCSVLSCTSGRVLLGDVRYWPGVFWDARSGTDLVHFGAQKDAFGLDTDERYTDAGLAPRGRKQVPFGAVSEGPGYIFGLCITGHEKGYSRSMQIDGIWTGKSTVLVCVVCSAVPFGLLGVGL
eukprot:3304644-Rhodomonas_salina.1